MRSCFFTCRDHCRIMKNLKLTSFNIVITSFAMTALFTGCGSGEKQMHSRGFHLPNGDPAIGPELFISMKCDLCHTVVGTDPPDYVLPALPKIEIGEKVNRVRSYGELVTSIISPEHVVSEKWLKILTDRNLLFQGFLSAHRSCRD